MSARTHPLSAFNRPHRTMYRPFSHHWTLDRSLFVGFNRNDVSLLHLVERGCCGYTIAEVICAYGSLVAYVCHPHSDTTLCFKLFCTAPLYFGEIGRSRTNRTFTRSFGDYCSTIKLYSHSGGDTWSRTKTDRIKICCPTIRLYPYNDRLMTVKGTLIYLI